MKGGFTLTVTPDGRAILSTPDFLDESHVIRVREAFETWSVEHPILLAGCDVVRVLDVELDVRGVNATQTASAVTSTPQLMEPFSAHAVSDWSVEPVIVLGFTAQGEAIVVQPDGEVTVIRNTEHFTIRVDTFGPSWAVTEQFLMAWDKAHLAKAVTT